MPGYSKFIAVLLLIHFTFAGCAGRKNAKPGSPSVAPPPDSTYIFDNQSLNGWEITNFGPQGPVYVSGGEIILGMGDGCTGITYKKTFPEIDYQVSLDAKRVSGTDFFCGMTFPVKKLPCTLIIGGWGGSVVGLSSINGQDASENETTRLISFTTDKWYHISLKVTTDSIVAWIDGARVISFGIGGKRLSIRPEVELSRPFGIASWKTTAALKNIRVIRIDGGEKMKSAND